LWSNWTNKTFDAYTYQQLSEAYDYVYKPYKDNILGFALFTYGSWERWEPFDYNRQPEFKQLLKQKPIGSNFYTLKMPYNALNFRQKPNIDSQILDVIKPNAKVFTMFEKEKSTLYNWVRVYYNGQWGWIAQLKNVRFK